MLKMFAAAALAIALVVPAVRADDKELKDIVDTAVAAKKFTTLVTAVKAADLVDTLKGPGPFTVFAPTDDAFKAVGEETLKKVIADKELLKKILLAHVIVDKAVMAETVLKMDGKKVNGFTIKIDGKTVMLSNEKSKAKVVVTDIKCKNGVIHVIDAVLMPE